MKGKTDLASLRASNTKFVFRHHHKTACPCFGCLIFEKANHFYEEGIPAGVPQADEQNTGMSTWLKATHIREIKILPNEKSPSRLRSVSYILIWPTGQALRGDRIDIMFK